MVVAVRVMVVDFEGTFAILVERFSKASGLCDLERIEVLVRASEAKH